MVRGYEKCLSQRIFFALGSGKLDINRLLNKFISDYPTLKYDLSRIMNVEFFERWRCEFQLKTLKIICEIFDANPNNC